MNPQKYKVILADDHALLREALANLVNSFDEFQVIATVGDGNKLVETIQSGTIPDIILLDLNMPGMDGFASAKWLQQHHPEIRILILTMYDSEIALIRLLQAGVKGFLKKDIHPSELRAALKSVSEEGYYYAHNTTGKLASLFEKSSEKKSLIDRAILTDKEIEFLRLASTDMTYKEIAHQLSLSPRAIDGYRDALFEKLDVKSRVGMAIYAVKNGVVTF